MLTTLINLISKNWLNYLKNPYVIASIIFVLLLSFGIIRISFLKSKVIKQNSQIQLIQSKLRKVIRANEETNKSLDRVVEISEQCASMWAEADQENKEAVKKINELRKIKSEKIKYIEVLQPRTVCDNTIVDNDFANWMRNTQANH